MPVQNYENLDVNSDVTTTRTLLHEVIPLTGSILSGTYGVWPNDPNIKNYTHRQIIKILFKFSCFGICQSKFIAQ